MRIKQGDVDSEFPAGQGPRLADLFTEQVGAHAAGPYQPQAPGLAHRRGQPGTAIVDHAALDNRVVDAQQGADPIVLPAFRHQSPVRDFQRVGPGS